MQLQKITGLTGHSSGIYKICGGPEPGTILSFSGDGQIVEWDLKNPENGKLRAKSEYKFFCGLYSRSTNACFAGDMNGSLYRMYFETERGETKAWKTHEKGLFALLELEHSLVSGGGDGTLTLWNKDPFFPKETRRIADDRVRSLIWDPDRKVIVAGSSDTHLYIVEPEHLRVIDQVENAHKSTVFSLLLSSEGSLISGGRDAMVHFWQYPEMVLEHAIPAHLFTVNDMALSPCGRWFATAGRDKEVRIWDLSSKKLLKVIDRLKFSGHINSVNTVYWDRETSILCSAGDDRSVMLWRVTA